MFWDGPPLIGIREEALQPFSEVHPECKLSFTSAPEGYNDKLMTMLAGGQPPDLFILRSSQVPKFLSDGILMDLTPFIERDQYDLSEFPQLALQTYSHEGGLFGLPDNLASMAIFYNVEMFDEEGLAYPTAQWDDEGWTVDEFFNACEKLTKVDATGRTVQYAYHYNTWGEMPYIWVRIFGGQVVDNPFVPTECTLDQPEAIAGLQFLADLRWEYGFAPKPEALGEMGVSDLLLTRRLAMLENGSWWFQTMRSADFPIDVGHFPKGPGGRHNYVFYFPLVIPKNTRNPECAWQLLKYFEGPAIDTIVRAGGLQGTRMSALEDIFLADPLPPQNKQVFVDAVKHFVAPDPMLTNWPEINQVITAELDLLWIGEERDASVVAKRIKQQIDPMIKEGQWRSAESIEFKGTLD
jgi:multiple sugar transport system substrate-binding protein